MTECGPASFTLVQTYSWIVFSQNGQISVDITIAPTNNIDAGEHTVVMQVALDNYPTVPVTYTVFHVTIISN